MTISGNDQDDIAKNARGVFWETVKVSFVRFIDEAPSLWKQSDAKQYRTEKRIINKQLDPLITGSYVTIFLFLTFRVSASRSFGRFRDQYITPLRSNAKAKPVPQKTNNNKQEWKGYLETRTEEVLRAKTNISQLPIDILLSIFCGISTALFVLQPEEIKNEMIQLPLVTGRSAIHEIVCPEFDTAFQKIDPNVFETNSDDETIRMFRTFVNNCRLRSEFIRSRELSGVRSPKLIPYPGVVGLQRPSGNVDFTDATI